MFSVTGATYVMLASLPESSTYNTTSCLSEDGLIILTTDNIKQEMIRALTMEQDYTLNCDDYKTVPKLGLHSGKTIHMKWTSNTIT